MKKFLGFVGVLGVVLGAGATWASGGGMTGTVTDEFGTPCVGASVNIQSENQGYSIASYNYVHTDGEGRWTVSGLEPGIRDI